MADTKLTRDHHLLTRNLKLNGNYISNDGGDEGISITDAGDITLTASGGDITINDGTLPIFTLNAEDSTFRIIDDAQNPNDYFQIDVEAAGATTISTVQAASNTADLTLSPDGDLTLNSSNIQLQASGADRGKFYFGTGDVCALNAETNDLLQLRASGSGGVTIDTTGTGDILIDSGADITLDAAGGDVTVLQADLKIPVDKKVIFGNTGEYIVGDDTDLDIVSSGSLTTTTTGAVLVDAGATITLDSGTGRFIAMNAGTQFSSANSAYAGMILGYTEIFDHLLGLGDDVFQPTTSSFVNLSLTQGGGEKYLKVDFVVPPSNKVKITVYLPFCSSCDGTLYLGLATDDSATTLHEDYERIVWDVDESDIVGIAYHWTIEGSDVSWSAGESKTIYAMIKEASTGGRIYSGDGLTINAGGWTMEAVALPATIGDGS